MVSIQRLLIANRGEIAVRIAKTAKRMGIETVGIYAENDIEALHTKIVDIALHLPGDTIQKTYLNGERIIEEAIRTKSDAIHPGYGFLAENARFAEAVQEAGLIWIGPTPEHIQNLGDKIIAKQTAVDAGVQTTQSHEVHSDGKIPSIAMPVIVKAAAGGGGRGMRIIEKKSDLKQAIKDASREALSSFDDGRVFLEPFVKKGRHVEVQIFGDAFGNVIHLGERECSIQRRNQKIIEETPSPGISQETRQRICESAVSLGQHVHYLNAGTVEFLISENNDVIFLEVNTRLQVEHPITEAVTGLDLVELQIRVAEGNPLPVTQQDIEFTGHAIEVRVVAENPSTNWLPSTGIINAFKIDEQIRVDTGIQAGSTITPDYDSLVAKIITHKPTRQEAIRHLQGALKRTLINGIKTNLPMLIATLNHENYQNGLTQTSFLLDNPEVMDGFMQDQEEELMLMLGSVFALEYSDSKIIQDRGLPSGWRNLRTQGERQIWKSKDDLHHIEYVRNGDTAIVHVGLWPQPQEDGTMTADQRKTHSVRLINRTHTHQIIEVDGRRQSIETDINNESIYARSRTGTATWERQPVFTYQGTEEMGDGPVSPLPGTVIAVHVKEGENVKEGDLLMVVEAMKMEHKILAVGNAKVATVYFQEGDRVNTGELLVSLDQDQ